MLTDGVILDVDGTIWDSTGIVAVAWEKAARDGGVKDAKITPDMLKNLFGKTMEEIADVLFRGETKENKEKIMELCCIYEDRELEADPCHIDFPGVVDTIKKLSEKVPVFIVSNCQSGYIELVEKKLGLEPYITDIECYGNTGNGKADNIKSVAERNHLKNAVYVGDTDGDRIASETAGVPFILAGYGFGETEGAAAEIDKFADLLELLEV
ncbi:phosphoglycolate phosphatase [Lachnospiraceae bacterium]|nr:phosphoglycolate phosphatase [Lachnospiraceae bacterium]